MPPVIHDRAYESTDDLLAMQDTLARWIQQVGVCGYCNVGDIPHRMFNGLRGRQPVEKMVRLWYAGKTLVAMGFVTHGGDFDVYVSPEHRSGEVERTALIWSTETARMVLWEREKPSAPIITEVFECDATRAELLTEMGFTLQADPPFLLNERLITDEILPVNLPEGYSIRSAAGEADAEQLAAVHSSAFGSSWTAELYRDEVMHKPGYDLERELVIVAPDGRFAAFCLIWRDSLNRIGYFEPVGTHADFQRRGLGKALMAYGLNLIREWGMTTAHVASESDNVASSALYQSVGFVPAHRILWYGISASS